MNTAAGAAVRRLRGKLVDTPDSVGGQRRAQRWQQFVDTFPDLSDMRVLDLGGRLETWRRAPVRAQFVHVVNFEKPDGEVPEWAEFVVGDVCQLPASVRTSEYDLVFSNSVIEHLGGINGRRAFAEAVHASAPRHWVQTPYRYFPVEPHVLFPGFQFLPLNVRATVAGHWPLLHTRPQDRQAATKVALGIELLGRTELHYLFPESEILVERMVGLPKSLVAVQRK
jgi:hypothetical protein